MKFLSLFSGIGGKDLGLERAEMTCVGQCEIDPFCRLILEKHWPHLPRWSNIRNFWKSHWENYCAANDITDTFIDLICGGFPCQDISTAGKGAGITGKRSGLWKEMYRIVGQFLPRWVLVENVPALRIKGADTVLSDLEEIGYTCWPVVVGAWAAGAPHQRNRVWIVAYCNDSRRISSKDSGKRESQLGSKGRIMAYASSQGLQERWRGSSSPESKKPVFTGSNRTCWPSRPGEVQQKWEPPRVIQSVGRNPDGVPSKMVRLNNLHALRAYGNSVVPDIVQSIGEAIAAKDRELGHGLQPS